jgi:hypothetical protein
LTSTSPITCRTRHRAGLHGIESFQPTKETELNEGSKPKHRIEVVNDDADWLQLKTELESTEKPIRNREQ